MWRAGCSSGACAFLRDPGREVLASPGAWVWSTTVSMKAETRAWRLEACCAQGSAVARRRPGGRLSAGCPWNVVRFFVFLSLRGGARVTAERSAWRRRAGADQSIRVAVRGEPRRPEWARRVAKAARAQREAMSGLQQRAARSNPSECPTRHPCWLQAAQRDVHPEPRVRASGTATAADVALRRRGSVSPSGLRSLSGLENTDRIRPIEQILFKV
jgi:hypothetical protein